MVDLRGSVALWSIALVACASSGPRASSGPTASESQPIAERPTTLEWRTAPPESERMLTHLEFFAPDAPGGRAPASAADLRAQDYVERVLKSIPIKPAFDGSFRQEFTFTDG